MSDVDFKNNMKHHRDRNYKTAETVSFVMLGALALTGSPAIAKAAVIGLVFGLLVLAYESATSQYWAIVGRVGRAKYALTWKTGVVLFGIQLAFTAVLVLVHAF